MDEIDRRILELLTQNARRPLSEIAEQVGLSAAPVKRRIERLEATGVIEGYTAVVNHARAGSTLVAFTEVRIPGTEDIEDLWKDLRTMPEVLQMFTIAGDPDALLRLRVDSVQHLQQVVNRIRKTGRIVGTKTLIVLNEWNR
ncbi:Lrp/AsnC family transcriptional regulator [Streptomyces sp. NPDC002680]|uniref:Lrp/AsnC family transcriptional regulator n=1 Tax=Streptomyces sp. NPDC002680 TaxID=3364659 RepID=UPI0036B05417